MDGGAPQEKVKSRSMPYDEQRISTAVAQLAASS
jgi:hypothetical protein